MVYKIRECKISDAKDIDKINIEQLGYEYGLEKTRKKLEILLANPKDKIFVAEANNNVVGYIHAIDYDVIYAPHCKNIMGIAVLKEYERNGIGKALLAHIENWAKETGAIGVRLVSGEARIDAHSFYNSCGYTSNKSQKNFFKILEK